MTLRLTLNPDPWLPLPDTGLESAATPAATPTAMLGVL